MNELPATELNDPFQDHIDDAAKTLGLLSNPNRLLILCKLAEGECSVSHLQDHVALSQSALSQHLAKLRQAGVLATRRESQTIYYRISDARIETIMATLYDLYCRPQ